VSIFQGRIEFIEKYFEIVRDLTARGFAVATLDWRGQGLSDRMLRERRKGHVANFAHYDIDLETFMRDVVLPDCPPPLFGLANSMGGAVLIRRGGARESLVRASGAVRSDDQARQHSAPAVGPTLARTMRIAGLGGTFTPRGGPACSASGPFLDNLVTSDPYAMPAPPPSSRPNRLWH
jgi:lysophospholipase